MLWTPAGGSVLTMVCACSLSKTHGNFLCYTTVAFVQPAAGLLLWKGHLLLGCTALALSVTSLLYHASHTPKLRTVDVALAQLTGTIATSQTLFHVYNHGWTASKVCAMLLVAMVLTLNHAPMFRQASRPDVLSLPGHVSMHALTGTGMALIAFAIA